MKRFAVGGIIHETNCFVATPTLLSDFLDGVPNPPLLVGEAVISGMQGLNIPIAGVIAALRAAGHSLCPLIWTEAGPGGLVDQTAFETLLDMLLDRLRAALPIDGVFLDLHGAMVTPVHEDAEGVILHAVRELVGAEVPIVVALDLHANVGRAMVDHADMLIACREYPHVDFEETGRRCADWLQRLADSPDRPTKAFWRGDLILPMAMQATALPAPAALYAELSAIERETGGCASFCMGFPLSDIAEIGPTFLCYTDDASAGEAAAHRFSQAFRAVEQDFALDALMPDAAVDAATKWVRDHGGPVVIADIQDNSGGGARSDSTGVLRALINRAAQGAVIGLFYDPEAAALAHGAGVGQWIELALGGRGGVPGDAPLSLTASVVALGDGEFICTGRFFRNVNPRLGKMALLRVEGSAADVLIATASERCQLADLAMLRHLGVEPTRQSIIVVKSTAHYRDDFAPIATRIINALAPGGMIADPAIIPYRRVPSSMRRTIGR